MEERGKLEIKKDNQDGKSSVMNVVRIKGREGEDRGEWEEKSREYVPFILQIN